MTTQLDWSLLPYFLATARAGSLRAAAEALGATHATVRRHVEALESHYGVRLFDRRRSGLTLTAAGKTLLPTALEAEEVILRGRGQVQGLDRAASGRIRLSVDPLTGHFLLAPILADFSALYPEIEFDVSLTYEIEQLSELKADVSIRHAAQITEDVTARKLFPLSLATFAARSYIDRELPRAGPKGEGLTWLGYGDAPELRRWIETSPFPRARVRHLLPDPQMHLHMVRAGAGMSILSVWLQDRFPELQRVPGTAIDQSRSTWLVLRSELARTRRVRVFVDYLASALTERRAEIIGAAG